jgi:hypothetical protein
MLVIEVYSKFSTNYNKILVCTIMSEYITVCTGIYAYIRVYTSMLLVWDHDLLSKSASSGNEVNAT